MLNKKILAASIAAAFTLNVNAAAVNLDAATIVPAKYASETVAASTKTTGKAFEIAGAANALDVTAKVGFGFTANTSFYVRYDLTNAVFETPITNADLTLAGNSGEVISLAQGGAEDDNYVIFEYVDTASVASTQVLTFTNDDLALTGTGDATIQMRIFATAPDAVNKTGSLVDKSGAFVKQMSAITTAFTANNPVADVDDSFTDFLNDKAEASLGSVKLSLAAVLAADDGALVARADVLTEASTKLIITGDFTNALTAGAGGVTLDTSSACSNAGTALTVNTGGSTATLTGIAGLADATVYTVCLEADPATTIAATDAFSATLDVTAGANGTYADQTATIGKITRNGTTLELPYLTTYSAYNQRLLITNNSGTDTSYSCTFTPEAGVTATDGAKVSGSVPANTTVSMKTSELVTLSGGTRVAGRCVLLSQSTNIDSALTTVNLSDKSTDTVTIN